MCVCGTANTAQGGFLSCGRLSRLFERRRSSPKRPPAPSQHCSRQCHTKATIEFRPHVNLVSGVNGSGKSVILTALQVALGARAKDTGERAEPGASSRRHFTTCLGRPGQACLVWCLSLCALLPPSLLPAAGRYTKLGDMVQKHQESPAFVRVTLVRRRLAQRASHGLAAAHRSWPARPPAFWRAQPHLTHTMLPAPALPCPAPSRQWNTGPYAFRRDLLGPELTVVRRINKGTGGGSVEVLDAAGRVVSGAQRAAQGR